MWKRVRGEGEEETGRGWGKERGGDGVGDERREETRSGVSVTFVFVSHCLRKASYSGRLAADQSSRLPCFSCLPHSFSCVLINNYPSPFVLLPCLSQNTTNLNGDFYFNFLLETSDHSDIESRVRRLKDQLEVRKREVKRLYNERKKQRKAMLRAQEASLRQELQVNFGFDVS